MDKSQEKKHVEEIQKNPKQFGEIFDEYFPKILNYCMRRLGDVELARDITAEVFFKAVKNLKYFKWRGISLSSWLYRIANNEINYYFRKKKYNTVSLDAFLEESGFEFPDKEDFREEILEAEKKLEEHQKFLKVQAKLKNLPQKYQEVIALRYFEDKKMKDMAEILGKKLGTIKSLLSRALHLLRSDVNAGSSDPEADTSSSQPFSKYSIVKSDNHSNL